MYALLLVLDGLSRFAGSRFDNMLAFDQANWAADVRSAAAAGMVLISRTDRSTGTDGPRHTRVNATPVRATAAANQDSRRAHARPAASTVRRAPVACNRDGRRGV